MNTEQRTKEVNAWYDFYMCFNDDNREHADNTFDSNGLQDASVEELHNENCKWFVEIMEHGLSPNEICNIMPSAKVYMDEAIAIKHNERVQQADALCDFDNMDTELSDDHLIF